MKMSQKVTELLSGHEITIDRQRDMVITIVHSQTTSGRALMIIPLCLISECWLIKYTISYNWHNWDIFFYEKTSISIKFIFLAPQ